MVSSLWTDCILYFWVLVGWFVFSASLHLDLYISVTMTVVLDIYFMSNVVEDLDL